MTNEHLLALEAALKLHGETAEANNRRLAAQMGAIPGAPAALRRFLATRGMNSEQIKGILDCKIPAEILPALLDLAPPKN